MSSQSDNVNLPSSSQFVPPESAQPYRSLFGGPSSDGFSSSQPGPPPGSIFGGPSGRAIPQLEPMSEELEFQDEDEDVHDDYDDLEALMREKPLEADYGSDGESFEGSLGDDEMDLDSEPDLPTKGKTRKSFDSHKKTVPPTTYVLHRGVDLPPGAPRPNRYPKEQNLWRIDTADERGAYQGITEERARDLAIHLYNTFKWRDPKSSTGGVDGLQRDATRINKKGWVSWPMTSDLVPRRDETIKWKLRDDDTLRMPPDPRASAELEESIIANMMKTAKETFYAGERQGLSYSKALKKYWVQWTQERKMREQGKDPTEIKDEVVSEKGYLKNANVEAEVSKLQAIPLWRMPQEPPRRKMKVKDFQTRSVFQADDDKSRRQLRPLCRTVISQVDDLLIGLHRIQKRRYMYHTQDILGKTRSARESETSRSRSRSHKRARQHSPGSTGRNRSSRPHDASDDASSNDASSDDAESDGPSKQTRGRPRNRDNTHRREYVMGSLRDWSEVMGVAAMIGLPSAAIMRASKRCADLFNQDMEFINLPEGQMRERSKSPTTKNRRMVYVESDDHMAAPKIRAKALRNQLDYEKRQVKRDQKRAEIAGNKFDSDVESPENKGVHGKPHLLCPFPKCPFQMIGFSRPAYLRQHLRGVHKVRSPSPSSSGDDATIKSRSPDEPRSKSVETINEPRALSVSRSEADVTIKSRSPSQPRSRSVEAIDRSIPLRVSKSPSTSEPSKAESTDE
ncbi:hypothetical protein N7532_009351 [Penicillium argentinense]|uniref:Rrn9 domain-containing protein n=1 Tax=Penicillium argentinense TaxID=1131581 RepID=A0A9W9EZ83_9EURO|nr:uncharacterized protein N7532_009351 [Penicillium argentinense]KAJ5090667.1 hypothetical protein N7532_009351 [Penicillium argentinense]